MIDPKSEDRPGLHRLEVKEVPAVVEKLEEFLMRAKSGEIRAIAIAAQAPERCTLTAYELGDGDMGHLVLGLERIKLRLLDI